MRGIAPLFTLLAAAPQENRNSIPDSAAQKEAERTIREVYEEEYAKQAPADKAALAKKLLGQAPELKDDSKTLFVVLREARDLAAQAGDVPLTLDALRLLANTFVVDGPSMKLSALAVLEKTTPAAMQQALMGACLEWIDEALQKDDLVSAEKIHASAAALANRARKWIDLAEAKKKLVAERKAGLQKIVAARKTLSTKPDDAAANLVVGKYECYAQGNWEKGLPLLAKGADADLKALAEQELSTPDDPRGQSAIGDGWLAFSEKETGAAKARLRDRAKMWYERAEPTAQGLTKTKVELRLAKLRGGAPAAGSWVDLKDPGAFGIRGQESGPIQVVANPGDDNSISLVQAPQGEMDGISLKARFPPGGRCYIFYEPPYRAFGLGLKGKAGIFEKRDTTLYSIKVKDIPRKEEYVITILLSKGEYMFYLDGEEFLREPTTRASMEGLKLQSNEGTTAFEDIRIRKSGSLDVPTIATGGGRWVDLSDPSLFGLAGKSGDPVDLGPQSNSQITSAGLLHMPQGEFDALALRFRFTDMQSHVHISYDRKKRGVEIWRETGFVRTGEHVASSNKWVTRPGIQARMDKPEGTLTLVLSGRTVDVSVNGERILQDESTSPLVLGLFLQACQGRVFFDQIKMRKKD